MNRLLVFTAVAFVAGGLVGALLVGAPFSPAAPKAVIFIHVENSGPGDVDASIQLRDAGGKLIVSTTFTAPAHSSVEKTVVNLQRGSYEVRGVFTHSGATASGTVAIDTAGCAEGTEPLATFTVSGTDGVAMNGAPTAGCRD